MGLYGDQMFSEQDVINHNNEINHLVSIMSRSPHNNWYLSQVDAVPDEIINSDYIIVTDNILKNNYINLGPEFWGRFAYNPVYTNNLPTKLFNCFINRVCSRRQIWFYEFVRRDLLNQGNVSFLLNYRDSDRYNGKWDTIEEKQQLFEWLYKECGPDFLVEHKKIKNQVPYKNFDASYLEYAIVDSKIGIVIETYFMGEAISFSEKIFRALQLPRPFLMYNTVGAVAALRNLGFEIYDDIINHDEYDNIEHPEDRMAKILSILEDFKNFNYTENTLIDFERRAQHNRDLLKSFKENWPEKFKKVEEQIKAISNNESLT